MAIDKPTIHVWFSFGDFALLPSAILFFYYFRATALMVLSGFLLLFGLHCMNSIFTEFDGLGAAQVWATFLFWVFPVRVVSHWGRS